MYQGLQFPLSVSLPPPLTLNRNQKIWKQILSSVLKTKNQLYVCSTHKAKTSMWLPHYGCKSFMVLSADLSIMFFKFYLMHLIFFL